MSYLYPEHKQQEFDFSPKHDVADRDIINHNGAFIPNNGIFVRSGSVGPVDGSLTGSVELRFNASALRLRRIEIFHSGSATAFNARLESASPNTGSLFDPRKIVACYRDVPGGDNFSDGLDQVEDLYALTDSSPDARGKLYLKLMPYGAGQNYFRYLMFFEAVIIYVARSGEIHV
jgi:hypothetical protein